MFNQFRKPVPVKQDRENCKIKVKKHSDGSKTVAFSGSCSKEQLKMAQDSMNDSVPVED